MNFFGCLFILLFGFIFVLLGLVRRGYQLLFGQRTSSSGPTRPQQQARRSPEHEKRTSSASGDAHHEGDRYSTRQKVNGKIFEKNEGKYVDFEEVPN